MQNIYIKIKDRNGNLHKWIIERETENTYDIVCNGFVSSIHKRDVEVDLNGVLFTDKVYSPISTIENSRYSKAEFCIIKLEY